MFDVSFPIAFVGGLVSFFAPCVIPLLPTYVAYVTGVSLTQLRENGVGHYQKKLLLSALLYILGFSLIFVLLGTAAAGVGGLLRQHDVWIQRIGGALILLFGLQFLGLIYIPFLSRGGSATIPSWVQNLGYLRSFFIGVVFAIVWTPCVGVILGSILTLAAIGQEALRGATLLFVYSLGISVPFLLFALTLAHAPNYIGFFSRHIGIISRVAGLMLIAIGILLLTDTYKFLNAWLFEIAFRFGYQIR